ncbi:MAG TPA: pantoate--beta-alanine ligase [Bacteroidales bacterium]|nr:pantoate--beta-alanine ligase [Bacteroidales bacterium]
MKRVTTVKELREHLGSLNISPIGFVPTMGALHEGHLSLVRRAVEECPLAAVSIFVNPTQFNDPEDLRNYPRMPGEDAALLSSVMRKDDILFIPQQGEIYPEPDTRIFSFGNLGKVMEGEHRPGHFNGVGQVVSRLFEIVRPDFAFFGQKDFQQLTIIRELVRQTGDKVKIVGCPIVREKDGLAMSSRNKLLETEIRAKAGIIFKTISNAAALASKKDITELREMVRSEIEGTRGFSLEYFEIADDAELGLKGPGDRLKPGRKYFACIAVRAGRIRLIDNVEIPLL